MFQLPRERGNPLCSIYSNIWWCDRSFVRSGHTADDSILNQETTEFTSKLNMVEIFILILYSTIACMFTIFFGYFTNLYYLLWKTSSCPMYYLYLIYTQVMDWMYRQKCLGIYTNVKLCNIRAPELKLLYKFHKICSSWWVWLAFLHFFPS